MRPCLKRLHQLKVDDENFIVDDNEDGAMQGSDYEEDAQPKQVQLKRKESERAQAARENSYAYLQKKEENESWISLGINDIGKNQHYHYHYHDYYHDCYTNPH